MSMVYLHSDDALTTLYHIQPYAFCNECSAGTKRRSSALVHLPSICPSYTVLKQGGRTGVHTVADVFCVGCGDRIGWYYHKAADFSQRYKEGMITFHRL
jgi:hypothetical protein